MVAGLALGLSSLASAQVRPMPPSNVCIDGAACTGPAPTVSASTGKKWRPGVYLEDPTHIRYNATPPKGIPSTTALWPALRAAHVRGVNLHVHWAALEPENDKMKWDVLDKYMGLAKASGLTVILDLWWAMIAPEPVSTIDTRSVPSWLGDSRFGGVQATSYGNTVRFWRAPVMDEFIELVHAICTRYDSDKTLEGIVLPETSWEFSGTPDSQYSDSALDTQFIRMAKEAGNSCKKTWVATRANWSPSGAAGMKTIIAETAKLGVGVGSTDAQPNRVSHADLVLRGAGGSYGTTDYRGQIPVPAHVEHQPYYGSNTPSAIYSYNKSTYGTTHLLVTYWNTGSPSSSHWTSWLPVIVANKGTVNMGCPKKFGACVTD